MLASILGLRSPLSNILNPNFLTFTLLPSDSDKPTAAPRPSSQPSSSTNAEEDGPSLKALATISALSGTLGLAAMTAAQSLTGYALLLALFGPTGARSYMREFLRTDVSALTPDHLAARAAMARAPRYAAFLALFSALGAALPEELLKYLPVLWLQRRQGGRVQQAEKGDPQQEKKKKKLGKSAAVGAAVAASLGFALVELAAYAQAAAASRAGPPLAVTLLERVLVGLPGHVATAMLSASRGADAEDDGPGSCWRAVLSAVAPSVAYHAVFDFILFGSSAWVGGHVGWVHPEGVRAIVGTLGACICVQGWLYAHTARAWLGWGSKSNTGERFCEERGGG